MHRVTHRREDRVLGAGLVVLFSALYSNHDGSCPWGSMFEFVDIALSGFV